MEEEWKQFWNTGTVEDYLTYRQGGEKTPQPSLWDTPPAQVAARQADDENAGKEDGQ